MRQQGNKMVGSKRGPSGVAGLVAKPYPKYMEFSCCCKTMFLARFETVFTCDLPQELYLVCDTRSF